MVITEIHYHPPGPDAEAAGDELIEILSREPPRVDLTGWSVEGTVRFRFPDGAVIKPGEYLVVARDPALFAKRHPGVQHVLGPYAGALDKKGGRITLRNAGGGRVCDVRYGTHGKWPVAPGGTGHTLGSCRRTNRCALCQTLLDHSESCGAFVPVFENNLNVAPDRSKEAEEPLDGELTELATENL
jgi:hypothetical protein